MPSYQEFLESKTMVAQPVGIEPQELSSVLYPFQQALTRWALRKGRAGIFADCGLGKTLMQLEWAEQLRVPTLIVAPLAVAQQTQQEGQRFGYNIRYAREQSQVNSTLTITNYELVDRFDAGQFGAVVLDESSILKAYDGKTKQKLIDTFSGIPYRLCCTATPAPNDVAELANHAEFLGIMTRAEMLASFFVHDDQGWRLKGHAADAFYAWLASWSIMLRSPADIGFDGEAFQLPELRVNRVVIDGDAASAALEAGRLFLTSPHGIKGRLASRKTSLMDRVHRAASIINNSDDQWLVWCGLNDEGRELSKLVTDAVLLEGKDSLDRKVEGIGQFLDGTTKTLITKAKIAGFGMNFQQCHKMMFLGLSDSYETYYQAIRRCWRFGQQHPVNVDIVISDLDLPVVENVTRKQEDHEALIEGTIREVELFQKAELGIEENRHDEYITSVTKGEDYHLYLGDCVDRMGQVDDASVDFAVFSPPFASLFTYSNSERDMGNCKNEDEFFGHYQFLVGELGRVIKPGRLVAIHVAQVAATLAHDGFIGIKDFRGRVIQSMIDGEFDYHGDITIDKNPQAQAIRTHSKALLFAQLEKDASWLRPGLADYILVFRRRGDNAVPIHPDISRGDWIEWAHPVWYGIRESDTLNVVEARTNKDERHICPLQLPVIERCIRLWTNPGETVLSPFAGIGSEGYVALQHDRKFVGVELKPEYYNIAQRNLERAIAARQQGRLL